MCDEYSPDPLADGGATAHLESERAGPAGHATGGLSLLVCRIPVDACDAHLFWFAHDLVTNAPCLSLLPW